LTPRGPVSTRPSMGISTGDTAPDFTLPTQDGSPVRLKDLLSKGAVVLYFYPKDDTTGCTAEACSFRDAYEDFKEAGAEVVGISSDSAGAHQAFADKHRLPFVLVSDEGGKVRKLYGVPRTLGLIPGRVTYVIDAGGVVRHVFNSQLNPTKHVREALEVLKKNKQTR
jgi:thioredoxin-dependent peroxiredoxin